MIKTGHGHLRRIAGSFAKPAKMYGSTAFDLSKVIYLISESKKANIAIKDQKIYFLLGSTGAGKTTTIQFLSGNKLIEDEEGKIVLKDPAVSKLKIGTQQKSETRFIAAQEVSFKKEKLILVDGPGFNDTEGPEMDLANAVSIADVFEQCSAVVPILLVSHAVLIADRGRLFRDLINYLCSMFPARELTKSLVVWVSQVPDKFKLAQLGKTFQSIVDADSSANTDDLISVIESLVELVEDEDTRVKIIKPLTDDVSKYHRFLSKYKPIKQPASLYKFSLNETVQARLLNTLKSVEMNVVTWLENYQANTLYEFLKSFLVVGNFVGTVKTSFVTCKDKMNNWIKYNQTETLQRFEGILKNKFFNDRDAQKLNDFSRVLEDVAVLKEFTVEDIMTVSSFENNVVSQLQIFEGQIADLAFDFETIKSVAEIINQFSAILKFKKEEVEGISMKAKQDIRNKINALKDTLKSLEVNERSLDDLVDVIENLTTAAKMMESIVKVDIHQIVEDAVCIIKKGFGETEEEFNTVFNSIETQVSSGAYEVGVEDALGAEPFENSKIKKDLTILCKHFSFIKYASTNKKLTKYLPAAELSDRFKRMVAVIVIYCNKTLDSMLEKLSAVDAAGFSQFKSEIDIISKLQDINEDIKAGTGGKNQKFLKCLSATIGNALEELQKEFEKGSYPEVQWWPRPGAVERLAGFQKTTD